MEETTCKGCIKMERTAKEKIRNNDSVIVVRCEKCMHYDIDAGLCRIWQFKTPFDGYCYRGKRCCLEHDKTYLEDYLEKHPGAKLEHGYPTVHPCDEYHELYYGWHCRNCHECWNRHMIAREECEND